MAYWKCAACGYEAQNDKQKQEHMTKTASDPMHTKSARPMGGQGWSGQSNPAGGMKEPWKRPAEPVKTPGQPPRVDPKWGGSGKGEQKP
jgi:hypothetical protein